MSKAAKMAAFACFYHPLPNNSQKLGGAGLVNEYPHTFLHASSVEYVFVPVSLVITHWLLLHLYLFAAVTGGDIGVEGSGAT
jgi:hypothetical protein